MKDIIYVSGHKNPDSDSICAATAYAEFKNKTQDIPAIAVRLGNVNQETQFILDYFGVEAPKLIKTVKLKVEDLDYDKLSPISPKTSLRKAWTIMKEKGIKSIPVADENKHLVGVLTTSNITSTYMDSWNDSILAVSKTSLENIVETLDAKILNKNEKVSVFPGKIVIAAMHPESMKNFINEGDIAIIGDRAEAQIALINSNVSLLIIAGGHTPNDEVVALAKEKGVNVILTSDDSYTTGRLIVQSIPVDYVMASENLVTVNLDDLADDAKKVMSSTRYGSYPVLNESNEVVGNLSRFHVISDKKKKLIQVDHNERAQAVDGIDDAEILEILDHHRVADIQTSNPIYFRNEPVGCCSTIIAKRFFENDVKPSREAAGLLCSAIISDTLFFKSPTCTPVDEKICRKLAEIAGVDLDTYAIEVLKAGTSLKGKTCEEIFNQDFKPFVIQGTKVGVAQVNTMDIEGFMPLKDDMIAYMNKKAEEIGADMTMLLLTDIIKEGSQILVAGKDPAIAEETFNVKLENDMAFLPGVLSRKKQVVPPLTNAISAR
ncbi:putative manganese-dependent inorganic diphosphatase [Clostridium massiliamazoniense]|uniref:putative manganese-dependent inorganic diphosphatase n=1 Tax=Clostridium massiliamazoniense TaxID=1347366 RepID=UPI0006D7E172|nr:putative manganese-dependent inorganic diphosphatase [Clostridium massiliamazoniense]